MFFYQNLFLERYIVIKTFYVDNYPLDFYQSKILLTNANILVIAGAGSGKTLTIIGKINYLIEYKNVLPREILVISFTNASVSDLQKRIKYDVPIYTFHKLAINILNLHNYSYNLCTQNLLSYIIKEYLINCSEAEQKCILSFLKYNHSYRTFIKSNNFNYFCKFIESFINLFQTTNSNSNIITRKKFKKIEKNILIIIFKIQKIFLLEKKSTNSIDFDDLIINATKFVKTTNINYKYIIIDEFQDTSYIRINLIKEIYKCTTPKIIVVGDDWQSIYRFSGCDLSIFLNFRNIFPNVVQLKLKNTYRNSQELINVATKFVQKNPYQIKKELLSFKNNSFPIIFVPYTNKTKQFKKILDELIKKTEDILILSRNNKDIYDYLDKEINFLDNYVFYKTYKFKYMSIHKSKGLEAKYTIILNCNNDFTGFPNKLESNSITKKVFPNENYNFSEERRLFYVAITRCKESTYIMYDKNNPSIFIKELKKIIKRDLQLKYFK